MIIFTLPLKVSMADLNNAVQGDHEAWLNEHDVSSKEFK